MRDAADDTRSTSLPRHARATSALPGESEATVTSASRSADGSNRATISASLLEQYGYTNVTVLDTGFNQWREAGYAVVEEARESRLLQH